MSRPRTAVIAAALCAATLLCLVAPAQAGPYDSCETAGRLALSSAVVAEGLAGKTASAAEEASRLAALALLVEALRTPVEAFHGDMYSVKNQRLWNYADALDRELAALDEAIAAGKLAEALQSVEALGGKAAGYVEEECKPH